MHHYVGENADGSLTFVKMKVNPFGCTGFLLMICQRTEVDGWFMGAWNLDGNKKKKNPY